MNDVHQETRSSTEGVTIDVLGDSDLDGLATFFAQWPGEATSRETWRRRCSLWWAHNPSYERGSPRGWAMRAPNRIVGFFGVVPLTFQVGSADVRVYGSTTWRVDPAFRHRSLSAMAPLLRHTKDTLLFISTQSPALVKILKALHFARLPRPPPFYGAQPNTLPLRLEMLAGLAGRAGPAARPFLRVGGAAWRTLPRTLERISRPRAPLEVRELARAGDDLDDLWARTRAGSRATNVRTSAILNWQCFSCDDRRKRLFGCFASGRLSGFAVTAAREVRGGMRGLECVDLWADGGGPYARALLAAIVRSAIREKVDFVEAPGFDRTVRDAAFALGFLPRRLADRGEWVLGPKPMLETLRDPSAYFCSLQGDAGL